MDTQKKIIDTFQVKIKIKPKRNEQQSEQNKGGIGRRKFRISSQKLVFYYLCIVNSAFQRILKDF